MPHTYRRVDDLEYDILKPDGTVDLTLTCDENAARLVAALFDGNDSSSNLIKSLEQMVDVLQRQVDGQKHLLEVTREHARLKVLAATIPGAN